MSPGAPTDDGGDPSSRCSLHRGVGVVVVVDGAVSPDGEESDGSSRRRYPTLLAFSTPPPTALPFLRGGGDEEDVDVAVAASGSAQDLAKMSVFRRSDRSGAGGCDGGVETATSARSPSSPSLLEGDGDDERKRNEAEQAADDDDDVPRRRRIRCRRAATTRHPHSTSGGEGESGGGSLFDGRRHRRLGASSSRRPLLAPVDADAIFYFQLYLQQAQKPYDVGTLSHFGPWTDQLK
jgi:hypothetical protein